MSERRSWGCRDKGRSRWLRGGPGTPRDEQVEGERPGPKLEARRWSSLRNCAAFGAERGSL